MSVDLLQAERPLFSYPSFKSRNEKAAPFLPMSRQEMKKLGWDSCDIILVVGDAYVDHPSFGMAVIGRTLEAQGYRVGIIAQPDWQSKEAFMALGKPNLFFGVSAGNMDSMINRYTAERRMRHDDAYTANNEGGKRPDRAVLVYTQRCKEAYKSVPVVIGGIEASLRRIAHYDYWSDKVRRSVILDAKADILLYGNAERPLLEVAHRLSQGEPISAMTEIRGTAILTKAALPGWDGVDSRKVDQLGKIDPIINPYADINVACATQKLADESLNDPTQVITIQPAEFKPSKKKPWEKTYIQLPSYEKVCQDKVHYAHASRIMHQETNPGCARALAQFHGERLVWLNPPAYPLTTEEIDSVFGLPYQRIPHPSYGDAKIPAYDMIRFSINIMRGCFGGCTFCSITEHEGRVIQSRSEDSIIKEIEIIRDTVPGFTGVISDLGGPTANMYRLKCKSPKAEQTCRRLSCVYPDICHHLNTDHEHTINLYRRARKLSGIKKILIASGVRYDIAVEDPRYVKELVEHHVGGYLKIAPEHTEKGPLDKMMKPTMSSYEAFKQMFEKYSKAAGKKQYLIPYFISAHPGTTDQDMINLALWLKSNNFKLDQVQNFYPSPLANATTMYHTEKNPLHKVSKDSEEVISPKGGRQRKLHKAILRYHVPENWPLIRETLKKLGLARKLIGKSPQHLVPPESRNELQGIAQQGKFVSKSKPVQSAVTRFTGSAQFKKATPNAKQEKSAVGKKIGSNKAVPLVKAENKMASKPKNKQFNFAGQKKK
ncbi:YgiQ family radical SAM protein [Psychromonas sp. MB-3u-54]|uniref:YgiQ family radical SAM protein n=1 Tax=Psychromonas sp. MB-3u-54 TaxID=2058319 RepID=UPI000C32CDB9|nr:YgiQ family radical SAM protein [Psychromonas sp. MB-3u-54]PKH01495.1 YgiQ family radical SAM protein [Psychromonas sp. MB-3u-54]